MRHNEDLKSATIYVAFRIGDIVYLRHNPSKYAGMVIGYNYRPPGTSYWVSWEDSTKSDHFDIELTTEYIKSFDVEKDDDD